MKGEEGGRGVGASEQGRRVDAGGGGLAARLGLFPKQGPSGLRSTLESPTGPPPQLVRPRPPVLASRSLSSPPPLSRSVPRRHVLHSGCCRRSACPALARRLPAFAFALGAPIIVGRRELVLVRLVVVIWPDSSPARAGCADRGPLGLADAPGPHPVDRLGCPEEADVEAGQAAQQPEQAPQAEAECVLPVSFARPASAPDRTRRMRLLETLLEKSG